MEQPNLQPRLLLADEIEDVLSAVPKVLSASKEVSTSIRNSMVDKLRTQLQKIKITALGIPDYKRDIEMKFNLSRIHPKEPVGTRAAESIGGPITQMALKSVDFKEHIIIRDDIHVLMPKIGELIDGEIDKARAEDLAHQEALAKCFLVEYMTEQDYKRTDSRELKKLGTSCGIKGTQFMKKDEIIALLLQMGVKIEKPSGEMRIPIHKSRIEDHGNETLYIDVSKYGWKALAVDEDGKMRWDALDGLTRHLPINEDGTNVLIEVKTRGGRGVTATKGKSFLTRQHNKIVPTEGKDLKVGDYLPVVVQAPNETLLTELDVSLYLSKKDYIYGSEMQKALAYKEVDHFWFRNGDGKEFITPFVRGDTLLDSFKRSLEYPTLPGYIYTIARNAHRAIPDKFQLDSEFGFFIGAYLAEGCCGWDNQVCISNNDPIFRKRIGAFFDSMSIGYHVQVQENKGQEGWTSTDIRAHSTVLTELIKKTCGVGSEHKFVPSWAFSAPEAFLKGLIDGYFSGDGCVTLKHYITASSVSERLIDGITLILNRFGIYCRRTMLKKQTHNNVGTKVFAQAYLITIANLDAKKFADIFTLTIDYKQERLEGIKTYDFMYPNSHGKNDFVPGIDDGYEDYEPMHRGPLTIKENKDESEIKALAEDVFWDSVISIDIVNPTTRFVYDVTVRETKNFATSCALNLRDTFHQSGSSRTVSTGIDAMRELINAQKKRKNPSMSIHFTNKRLSFEEVYAKRGEFTNITVGNVVAEYDIDPAANLPRYWWHDAYQRIMKKQIPITSWAMRLTLNVNLLYAYKITMEDVARAIEMDTPPSVICICSPISIGIIDVYPVEAAIGEAIAKEVKASLPLEQAGITFLNLIVLPNLDNITIKGIKGVKALFPVVVPVWQVVKDEIRVFGDEAINAVEAEETKSQMRLMWYLVYNKFRMGATGLSIENLRNVCTYVGMTIAQETPDYIVVVMPELPGVMQAAEEAREKKERFDIRRPGKYVQRLIEADEAVAKAYVKERREAGETYPRKPISDLERVSSYVYADTNGTNLRGVLVHEEVDIFHTISNDFHEVAAVLGIKAARNLWIKEFLEVIGEEGSYINPRHPVLMADFISNQGLILPITFAGASRQPIGAIAKASFERTLETVSEAAAFGRKEAVVSTTASIFTGKRMRMGTGGFEVNIDEEKLQKLMGEMKQLEVNKEQVALVDLETAIQDLQIGGEGPMMMGNEDDDLEAMFGKTLPAGDALGIVQPVGVPAIINTHPTLNPLPTIMPALMRPTQLVGVIDKLTTAPMLPTKPEQTITIPVPVQIETPVLNIGEQPALVLPQITQKRVGLPMAIAGLLAPKEAPSPTILPRIPSMARQPSPVIPALLLPALNLETLAAMEGPYTKPREEAIDYKAFLGQ